jgi:hypothetical protein
MGLRLGCRWVYFYHGAIRQSSQSTEGLQSPKSQFIWGQSEQSQSLRAWKLGLITSHKVPSLKSQVWHGCLHDSTFCRWGPGLVLRGGFVFIGYKPHLNSFLRLKSWGFAFMLGLGTSCELVLSYAHDIYQGSLEKWKPKIGETNIIRVFCKVSQ